jgi:hypothetical protein
MEFVEGRCGGTYLFPYKKLLGCRSKLVHTCSPSLYLGGCFLKALFTVTVLLEEAAMTELQLVATVVIFFVLVPLGVLYAAKQRDRKSVV